MTLQFGVMDTMHAHLVMSGCNNKYRYCADCSISGQTSEASLWCTGRNTCVSINKMENLANIYCLGEGSCQSSTIRNSGNVYLYRYAGAGELTIRNVAQVYCGEWLACWKMDVDNIKDIVMVNGFHVLHESTVNNLVTFVCIGTFSCRANTI